VTEKKETVGSASRRLQMQSSNDTAEDLQKGMQESSGEDSYENQVRTCVERGCRTYDSDFYVVVIFKKEKLMQNVIRQYFFPRVSCPTPDWDQTVYFFNRTSCTLEFVWTVPDKNICEYMTSPGFIPGPEEFELCRMVRDFHDGTLLIKSKKLNKESHDSNIIQK